MPVDFLNLIVGAGDRFDAMLGKHKLEKAHWDPYLRAHSKYGIAAESGMTMVIRADGILRFAEPLYKIGDMAS